MKVITYTNDLAIETKFEVSSWLECYWQDSTGSIKHVSCQALSVKRFLTRHSMLTIAFYVGLTLIILHKSLLIICHV